MDNFRCGQGLYKLCRKSNINSPYYKAASISLLEGILFHSKVKPSDEPIKLRCSKRLVIVEMIAISKDLK